MSNTFRVHSALLNDVRSDLRRPHPFAHERMGFFYCRAARLSDGVLVLAEDYSPISDQDYIEQHRMGAMMNGAALRKAMQRSLSTGVGVFHTHMHLGRGIPHPSPIDMREARKFIPDFFNVTPAMPHGTVILSADSAFGLCWQGKSDEPGVFNKFEFVGIPLRLIDSQS